MSNIMWREIRWTCGWLRTYVPWSWQRKNVTLTRLIRKAYRKQLSNNKVFASFWAWLRGR